MRERPTELWVNSDSTSAGQFDRISLVEAAQVRGSLLLIKPEDFGLAIGRNWAGRKSFRGVFIYHGTRYSLSVTDPHVREAFGAREEGHYPLDDVYLCISLTEPYEHDDKCHKLVAAIIGQR